MAMAAMPCPSHDAKARARLRSRCSARVPVLSFCEFPQGLRWLSTQEQGERNRARGSLDWRAEIGRATETGDPFALGLWVCLRAIENDDNRAVPNSMSGGCDPGETENRAGQDVSRPATEGSMRPWAPPLAALRRRRAISAGFEGVISPVNATRSRAWPVADACAEAGSLGACKRNARV